MEGQVALLCIFPLRRNSGLAPQSLVQGREMGKQSSSRHSWAPGLYVSGGEVIQTPSESILCECLISLGPSLGPLSDRPAVSLQPHTLSLPNSVWLRHGFPCPEDTWATVWSLPLSYLHVCSQGVMQTAVGCGGRGRV